MTPGGSPMSQRIAAMAAALLASSGLAVALPVVALAGDDDTPDDPLTQENPPPPIPTQTTPTPTPTPTPPPPPPRPPPPRPPRGARPPAPPQAPLPPVPTDTLQDTQSSGSNSGSN